MSVHVPRSAFLLGAAFALSLAQATHAAPPPAAGEAKPLVAADGQPAKPRKAEKATSIPEPGSPTLLFLLAAGGLAIGRRLSRSKRRRSPEG